MPIFIFMLFGLASCRLMFFSPILVEAPEEVRIAALRYAEEYARLGAVYEWGGQDPLPRVIRVDCSGLVIRCYGYACEELGYLMPFNDMNAAGMQQYCKIVSPEPGDLIFMGDDGLVSHIAIFKELKGSNVYFIDATSITGKVTERYYPSGSGKFIIFGRLLLYKQE